jgi:hypothetical protein
VHPRELLARNRQEAERILLAQIRLADERERGEVSEVADDRVAQPVAVKGHVRHRPADDVLEPFDL